jgi:hypothetical protein
MSTSYTSLLGLALPATGENNNTWGDLVNNSITSLVDSAVAGTTTISNDADITLSTATGIANEARQAIILWSATGTVTRTITAPAASKVYIVINKTGGTQDIQFKASGSSNPITITSGSKVICAFNGTDFVAVTATNFSNILLGAGTTAVAPIKLTSGTNLTTPAAGALEYDGTAYYATQNATQGRGVIPTSQYYYLSSANNNVNSFGQIFPSTLITLDAGFYTFEAEIYYFLNTSAYQGYSFYFSAGAVANINIFCLNSGTAGLAITYGGTATPYFGVVGATSSPSTAITVYPTTTLLNNKYYATKINASWLVSSSTNLTFSAVGSSANYLPGSTAKLTKLPTSNVGNFS